MRSGLALVVACAVLAGGMAMAKTPPLRGVVEGYYGQPWTGDARRDVIRFLGAHGMIAFVYAPKNDDLHRARWREPYPAEQLAEFRETAAVARQAHVRFIYALSPALDVCYSCPADFDALMAKLGQLATARVRHFALFFDDSPEALTHPEDIAAYEGTDGTAVARAHADLVNRVTRALRRRNLKLSFMVPTDYAGLECRPYHGELGRRLRSRMPIGWTGSGVFAATVTGEQARARRLCAGNHPVVLWDNFPVNDTVLSNGLHLGPITGRDARLPKQLEGHLLNPMTQAHASLVALGTAAAYLKSPRRYDPEKAWRAALGELDSGPGLAILAEQLRSSPLSEPDFADASALTAVVDALASSYDGADWPAAVAALDAEQQRQASVPSAIAQSLGGTPLATEIAPWVAELADHAARWVDAARLLRAMKPSITAVDVTDAGAGMVRIHGRAVAPDSATAALLGAAIASPPPADVAGYLGCLGTFLGADIGFCPQFGLNVHGKRLLIYPTSLTSISIVTGKNVHDRLLATVATAYAAWSARQPGGSVSLALTLDGTAVPLDGDGGFDVTAPLAAGASARLVVTTSAGDATAVAAARWPSDRNAQQRARRGQVRGVGAFVERRAERRQQAAGVRVPPLLDAQSGQADRRAQLPPARALAPRDRECPLERRFRTVRPALDAHQALAAQAMQLGPVQRFAVRPDARQRLVDERETRRRGARPRPTLAEPRLRQGRRRHAAQRAIRRDALRAGDRVVERAPELVHAHLQHDVAHEGRARSRAAAPPS